MQPIDIDASKLTTYLKEKLPGFSGNARLRRFEGGQSNPTYLLEDDSHRYVLRRKPGGELLATAHMIEREYRVLRALRDSSVPVARARLLCEDVNIIGTAFYVMDYVPAEVHTDPRLRDIPLQRRGAMYLAMMKTLADLHRVDVDQAGLGDFGRRSGYVSRQLTRWSEQYRATRTEPIEAMERLLDWLPRHVPATERVALTHGDFRLGNLMYTAGTADVAAILDWELATIGEPLCDLAYCCMFHHLPVDTPNFSGLADTDLAALGIPDEATMVSSYARHAGLSELRDWPFYLAFAMFRVSAISQGVYARALAGNAADHAAHSFGKVAKITAEAAWRIAQTS